jgi:hypothetical protein
MKALLRTADIDAAHYINLLGRHVFSLHNLECAYHEEFKSNAQVSKPGVKKS